MENLCVSKQESDMSASLNAFNILQLGLNFRLLNLFSPCAKTQSIKREREQDAQQIYGSHSYALSAATWYKHHHSANGDETSFITR
jgi:hypothetical protein